MNVRVNMCPCGSGLRVARCCRFDLATVGTGEAARHLLPLVDRAIALNPALEGFLAQDKEEVTSLDASFQQLGMILDSVAAA